MSTSHRLMPSGGTAYIIHRKVTVEAPALIHFGFGPNSLALCGFCGAGFHMKAGQTLEDLSARFKGHCKTFVTGLSGTPPHPSAECLSEGQLSNALAVSFNSRGRRHVMGSSRSRLLDEQFLVQLFGQDVMSTLTRTESITVCTFCLGRGSSCCIEHIPMKVT